MQKLSVAKTKIARSIVAEIKSEKPFADLVDFRIDCQNKEIDDPGNAEFWKFIKYSIQDWSDKARADFAQLQIDCERIEKEYYAETGKWVYLFDGSCAVENIDHRFTENSIGYWPAMFGAACNVVAVSAENSGIDVNARLGRAIY
jgi:hypothetical protein